MRRRDFIKGLSLAGAVAVTGCSTAAMGTGAHPGSVLTSGPALAVPPAPREYVHKVSHIPVLAWHQIIGGVAVTAAEDVIWNYNRDCKPATAVCDVPANDETVSLAQMDAQLSWLRAQGYRSITADQYYAWVSGRKVALPARPVLLTVDDGTLNSYVGVTAMLARHGMNMVTFIVTQFADGATANVEPYAGWNASWDQLLSLPEEQWSFAFHAGAHGHNITFPDNKACQYYYPCQLPAETVSDYRTRVASEIAAGRAIASARLGSRMNDTMWAVPWGDVGIQANLPATGDAETWLAPWAATQFPVIFIQDPAHNGYLHERYRLVVQGNWSQAAFEKNVQENIAHGFFNTT